MNQQELMPREAQPLPDSSLNDGGRKRVLFAGNVQIFMAKFAVRVVITCGVKW